MQGCTCCALQNLGVVSRPQGERGMAQRLRSASWDPEMNGGLSDLMWHLVAVVVLGCLSSVPPWVGIASGMDLSPRIREAGLWMVRVNCCHQTCADRGQVAVFAVGTDRSVQGNAGFNHLKKLNLQPKYLSRIY